MGKTGNVSFGADAGFEVEPAAKVDGADGEGVPKGEPADASLRRSLLGMPEGVETVLSGIALREGPGSRALFRVTSGRTWSVAVPRGAVPLMPTSGVGKVDGPAACVVRP